MKRSRKNKNNNARDYTNIAQWRKTFLLNRRENVRKQLKETAEQERNEVFNKKLREADGKKSVITLRTKGYYRFAREFPAAIDENGFRENTPDRNKNKLVRIGVPVLIFALIFSIGYVLTSLGVKLSMREPETEMKIADEENLSAVRAYHFSAEELSGGDINYIKQTLTDNNCNTALFEFKSEYGYVYFDTGSFLGASADRRISSAADTVTELKASGIKTAAYISAYKDTVAATADLTLAVRNNSAEGGAWLDNTSSAWLNPYSDGANTYVLDIISAADNTGFNYIFLDNVSYASDATHGSAFFTGASDSSYDKNAILALFVNSAVRRAVNGEIILMCNIHGFCGVTGDASNRYSGNMLQTDALSYALDARLSVQEKNIKFGSESFSNAGEMPYVFVLAAAENAQKNLSASAPDGNKTLYAVIERSPSTESELNAISFEGIDNYVLW